MNKIKYLVILFSLILASCSKEDGTCPCVRTSSSSLFNGEVDEGYCTGEIENPSPNVLYQRICNY